MKRKILIIIVLLLLSLTSCYSGYSGDYSDLYTVAINSVLWLNGYSWGPDFQCDPSIEIVDEDQHGRIMYIYREAHYKGADTSFFTLIICQDSNEEEVFYYEDINYIIKEETLYYQNFEKFTDEEIENLKLINDWNKEINYDKCIKKEIVKYKGNLPYEKEIKNLITEEFNLDSGDDSLFMDFLTYNGNNSKFVMYGYIRNREGDDIHFVSIVEEDVNSIKEMYFLVAEDEYDYGTEFIGFKLLNDWY